MSAESATAVKPACQLVRANDAFIGKQGLSYFHGISAESTGSANICMHLMTIPPLGRAKVHLHDSHETTIYVISGHGRMWHGDELEKVMDCGRGDLIYIPAGVPHLPTNPSETEPCIAVLARTDPNEQESVVLLPELERFAPA